MSKEYIVVNNITSLPKFNLNGYYSQKGQDKFIIDFFNKKKNGYFIEIGGYDGITNSNTYKLEKEFNWNGLLVEPSLHLYNKLKNKRNCKSENCIIVNEYKDQVKFIDKNSPGSLINDAFDNNLEIPIHENIKLKKKKLKNIKNMILNKNI